MQRLPGYAVVVLAAAFSALAARADVEAGRQVYQRHCSSCHESTSPGRAPLGPDLRGIIGRKAGGGESGMHSRAAIESGVVWDRALLRSFVAHPYRALPGTVMPEGLPDAKEREALLDYLESLR